MADTYVLWTPLPRREGDLLEVVPRPPGARPVRRTARRLPVARAAAEARTGSSHRWWPRGLARPVLCPVRVSTEWPDLVAGKDVDAAGRLAERLRRSALLVLALTPPPVLLEHLWRRAVWNGDTRTLESLVQDGLPRVQTAYDRLVDLTAAAARREVVASCPGRAEDLPPPVDPAWQLSARGVEVLRRMNTHAVDAKERRWMRDFCLQTFPRAVEPEAAVASGTVTGEPEGDDAASASRVAELS